MLGAHVLARTVSGDTVAAPGTRPRGTLGRLVRDPLGCASLAATLAMALAALAAPWITPWDPFAMARGEELQAPSAIHWAGTDEYGRDILGRVVWGARVSLGVGVLAVLLGGTIGIGAGLAAGYWERWVDTTVMRISDALLAFPAVLLGIALTALLRPGAVNAALALAIISAPQFARIARAGTLAEKQKEYAFAAHALGCGDHRVVFRHILPNLTSPIVVQLTLAMAFAALLEAGLSFLGLGVQPPDPSWGSMLNSSRTYLRDAPWYAIAPGAALSLLLLALHFLSDSIRAALDPRARTRDKEIRIKG